MSVSTSKKPVTKAVATNSKTQNHIPKCETKPSLAVAGSRSSPAASLEESRDSAYYAAVGSDGEDQSMDETEKQMVEQQPYPYFACIKNDINR